MFGGNFGVEACLFFGGEGVQCPSDPFDRCFNDFARIFFAALKENMFEEMGRAFDAVFLMPAADADPEAQRDAVAVFHIVGDQP